MFIIEMVGWIIKFVFVSVYHLVSLPFVLISGKSWDYKRQYLISSLLSAPILFGAYLMFDDHIVLGVLLILGAMILGAVLVKEDGTI